MFKSNFGTSIFQGVATKARSAGNNNLLRLHDDIYMKATIQNGSLTVTIYQLTGLTVATLFTRTVVANGCIYPGVGEVDNGYWVSKNIVREIDTNKFVIMDDNGYWVFVIDAGYNVTMVNVDKLQITTSITQYAMSTILPVDLTSNTFVILGGNNKIQRFQVTSGGAISLIGSEQTLSAITENFRIVKLTGNRYFLGNATKYMILNSTFGTIVGESDLGITTKGIFQNNYKNPDGSDYIVFFDSANYAHSLTVDGSNAITISAATDSGSGGYGSFYFLNDTTGFMSYVQSPRSYMFYMYLTPFEIGVDTCIFGTAINIYNVYAYAGYLGCGYVADFVPTPNPSVFLAYVGGCVVSLNIGNGYATEWSVELATKTGTDSFNRLTINYSASLEADTSYTYYYTLNGSFWYEYANPSGTEITVPSSTKLGLKAVGHTTDTTHRATLDYLTATVRTA